jgi:hypothetical protein
VFFSPISLLQIPACFHRKKLAQINILCYSLSVRIFKYPWFKRYADKESLSDDELKSVVKNIEEGRIDADLGGGVYKQRIARTGAGKSVGYRSIVYFRSAFRTFFVYAFAKSDRANIGDDELKAFKADAKIDFALTDEQIAARLQNGTLYENI